MKPRPRFIMRAHFGAKLDIDIVGERASIGRGQACDIRIDEPGMPPSMGIAVASMGEIFLVADSEDKPFIVNGLACQRKVLRHGDVITFSQCEMEFDHPEAAAAAAAPPPPPLGSERELEDALIALASRAKLAGQAEEAEAKEDLAVQEASMAKFAQLISDPAPTAWIGQAWAKLIPIHDPEQSEMLVSSPLAMIDFGHSKATLSRRRGQCFATLVSGVVFCAKERLGSKPRALVDSELIAADGKIYLLRLANAF